MPTGVYALSFAIFVGSACAAGLPKEQATGPERLLLVFDQPRREDPGVSERWVVAAHRGEVFLLHAWDVERRRTRQNCGAVPAEAFGEGWQDLETSGLLTSGEDLRMIPSAGEEPFFGRYQMSFHDQGTEVTARRPLARQTARNLIRVLRGWEARLRPVDRAALPVDLLVEVAIGDCGLGNVVRQEPMYGPPRPGQDE